MDKLVGLAGPNENVVEVQLAELQADESTRGTTRRGVLGTGGADLAGFDSGSARTSWVDTSGA